MGPKRRCPPVFAGLALALAVAAAPPSWGALEHTSVVSANPADSTPSLVDTGGVERPIVDALTQSGDTVFAGGRFTQLTREGQSYGRTNLVSFDAHTGAVSAVDLQPNGRVSALAAIGDWVYVGGEFTTIGGVSRRNLARVNATTGVLDLGFRSPVRARVNALVAANGMLYVGGSFAGKLIALDPVTGANTQTFDLAVTDALPNAWGTVTILGLAINVQGTKLVATGNFMRVAGQARSRLFVADLSGPHATLDPWYYQGFARACSSTSPRRIAYLQGVDFSPDGSYFVVTATGQISRPGDRFVTVCDGAGRFDLANDAQPAWINYTGGDSVWAASVTGAAVYVQGHFQWLDNPFGFASRDGGGAARRLGIGAIDPTTGRALPWAPPKPAQIGGRVLLATPAGLWVGSDSVRFNGEPRRGLAFCPLP